MPRKADERTAEKIVEDTIEKLISSSIFAEESRINEFNIQQLDQGVVEVDEIKKELTALSKKLLLDLRQKIRNGDFIKNGNDKSNRTINLRVSGKK